MNKKQENNKYFEIIVNLEHSLKEDQSQEQSEQVADNDEVIVDPPESPQVVEEAGQRRHSR